MMQTRNPHKAVGFSLSRSSRSGRALVTAIVGLWGSIIRISPAGLLLFLCFEARLDHRFGHLLPRLLCQPMMWIEPLKLLKRFASVLFVVEIVFVDLADAEQRVDPRLASWILLAKKFVLLNRGVQNRLIFKAPPFFFHQFGAGNHAGIGFGGSGRPEVDPFVSVDDTLVVGAG